jgi:hypothetical protein
VSALEGALRASLSFVENERRDLGLDDLINEASRKGSLGVGKELVDAAHQARITRNKVAHGSKVESNESEEILDRVRLVLEHLRRIG